MKWQGLVGILVIGGLCVGRLTAEDSSTGTPWLISMTNYLRLVAAQNERVQIQELEYQATRHRQQGEYGIFEPAWVFGVERQDNKRENTSERQRSLLTTNFTERNTLYNSALEFLVPTGAKLRLGANLRDLHNNIQFSRFTNGEMEAFSGVSVVQPLLKGAGVDVTMAGIRIASKQSEASWQEYRRQFSQVLAGAETAYFGLYLAQEQVRFFDESVKVAETVLADAKARSAAGKGAEQDILQAEADLAMRRNGRSEATQKLAEARARATGFMDSTEGDARGILTVESVPPVGEGDIGFDQHWAWTFDLNPDLRAQRARLDQEGIRVAYARNQRMPQLDLKGSYGLNGLGETASVAWDRLGTAGYPSWSIGIELRIPLGGGIKERHELAAAKLRQKASLLQLKELETQLGNTLRTTISKVRYTRGSVVDYQTSIRLTQSLLDTELARLQVGRVEARKVLEVERDLLQAKLSELAAQVSYQQAELELAVINGTYLAKRGLEKTRQGLADQTDSWLRNVEKTTTPVLPTPPIPAVIK